MRHANSLALLTYWNRRRGNRPYPLRSEIEPGDIARLLPHVFIGERSTAQPGRPRYTFRLAGTAICTLAGGELKGTAVSGLWLSENQRNITSILDAAGNGTPVVLALDGLSEDARVLKAEAVILPLGGLDGRSERLLGCISVFSPPYWIGHDVLAGFATTGMRFLDPEKTHQFLENRPEVALPASPHTPAFAPTQANKRHSARLFLIEGGRKD
ncbi:PAS domain-containing protein [Pseudohoeflea coraliihabitans]|uniref:PAS domain-containing protein n=1 Tax=Pseudohoeflea coraliihabitans TaxID=2860393 RepID=A0ABS6WQI1_9HYPH|nr:PAS domain-containing protein [Pseudohoeflea sp. DP4N28-3]MBW3098213.1 PAS domain-containing protein [Pseudohoeflea sp. DP4N28-3]